MADAGMTGREMAERLQISPSAVSQRLAAPPPKRPAGGGSPKALLGRA